MSNTTINVDKSSTQETNPEPFDKDFGNYTYPLSLLGYNFTTGNYNIKMTATNAIGTSVLSNIVNFTIVSPTIPSNLTGTVNGTIVLLSWDVSSSGSGPITSFDIQYFITGGSVTTLNVLVGSAPIVNGKYTYSLNPTPSLLPSTIYNIQVRARNSFGPSGYSTPPISVTTAQQSTAPSTPYDVSGNPNTTSILLDWLVADQGFPPPITAFDISYNSGGTIFHTTYNPPSSPIPLTYFYELTGLQILTLYYIQINATNSSGLSSAYSTQIKLTTLTNSQNWYGYPNSTSPSYIYTNVPTIFFPSISLNPNISVVTPESNDNWTLGTTGNLYTTYPVSVPSVRDSLTSLTGGVLGNYWENINGILTTKYPIYIFISQIISPNSVPTPPVLGQPDQIDISYNSVVLTWTVASDGSSLITSFNISYSPSNSLNVLVSLTGKPSPGTFTYTLNGLNTNTIYDISLNAVNSFGASAFSNTIQVTTSQIPGQGSWYLITGNTNPNLPGSFIFSNAPKILFSSFILDSTISTGTGSDGWVTLQNGYLSTIDIPSTTNPYSISMPESYSSSQGFDTSGLTPGPYWQVIGGILTTQYPVVFKIGQIST